MGQKFDLSITSVFLILLKILLGSLTVIFSVLALDSLKYGFVINNFYMISSLCVGVITTVTVLSIVLYFTKYQLTYKISLIVLISFLILCVGAYIFNKSGLANKINSVDDLRSFVSSFGNFAVIIFILIQFLQVVILPIPAFITVATGVLLFGAFKGALFSVIGIILGSIVAFYIGRFFGYKTVKWLIGKEKLDAWLKKIKGKDKIILTFMFLFPFFPDDVLCFVSGITSMSSVFFVFMIIITRIISVFASSYSLNNSIIPYNTWWGIVLWVLFFALTVFLTVLIYKKGDKLEKFFNKRKSCK